MNEIATIAGAAFVGAALKWPATEIKKWLLCKRMLEPVESRGERWMLPLAMGGFGGLLGWRLGFSWALLYGLLLLLDCAVIAVIDARYRIIPNDLILALLGLTAVFGGFRLISFDLWSSVSGLAVCFVLFLLPSLFGKKIGAGDVKLAGAMGFCAGLMGSLYAVVIMGMLILAFTLVERRTPFVLAVKSFVPMGPFIAVALMAVQLF